MTGVTAERARAWFEQHAEPKAAFGETGVASKADVAVFHDLHPEAERALLEDLRSWHQRLWAAGLAGLDWPREFGGQGLGPDAAEAVAAVAAEFATPPPHELFLVTTELVAPTVLLFGDTDQRERIAPALARAELLCAQLFSEPAAGSDLAGLSTRARFEAEQNVWVVNGQKVWSSGAQFADLGLLIARTDDDAVKHAGLTAFLLPMDLAGVDVRPLRQMSGGASFCEVFLTDVRLPGGRLLGGVGNGWKVATTTLGFERNASGADTRTGGSWTQVLQLARSLGRTGDPLLRQRLADVYIHHRLAEIAAVRDRAAADHGSVPSAQGSLRKLQWVNGLTRISHVVSDLLGPRLTADTGERGTFAWTAHVLGAPGYRIAGGTDEIQRTIIAERLLGLPPGPRVDRDRPWREIPR